LFCLLFTPSSRLRPAICVVFSFGAARSPFLGILLYVRRPQFPLLASSCCACCPSSFPLSCLFFFSRSLFRELRKNRFVSSFQQVLFFHYSTSEGRSFFSPILFPIRLTTQAQTPPSSFRTNSHLSRGGDGSLTAPPPYFLLSNFLNLGFLFDVLKTTSPFPSAWSVWVGLTG